MTPATLAEPLDLRRSFRAELSAAAALFVLTVRQYTHGRRLLVLALLYALPVGLAVLLRSLARPAPTDALELALVLNLLPHGLAPLTALLYAAGVVRDEVEEQTLTYLLMRSVPRWAIYAVRLAAAMCITVLVVAVATAALYAAIFWGTPELWGDVLPYRAARAAAAMAVGQVGYCALFGFLGLFARRSLIVGLGYIAAVEGFLGNIDFMLRKVTVVYYVRTLFLRWVAADEATAARWQEEWGVDLALLPSAAECVWTVVGAATAVMLLTALWFARSEFRVKTPGEG